MGIVHGGKIYLNLDDIEKDYVSKSDLNKTLEDWNLIEEVSGSTYTKRCIEDIEKLLYKGEH